jgi:hypothetical protein
MLHEHHVHTAFSIIRGRSWNVLPMNMGALLYIEMVGPIFTTEHRGDNHYIGELYGKFW